MDLLQIFEAERLAQGSDYKVTLDDVRSFLLRYVYNDPTTVAVEGATVSALWSFEIAAAETRLLSNTLAEQSGAKVRTIGSTAAGQFLAALLSDSYADKRVFTEFPVAADGTDDFWSRLSQFFVANTDGPLITITPGGLTSSVYGTTEVSSIIDNDAIETINGTSRSDIGFNIFSSNEEAQKAYLMAMFNGEFSGDIIASNAVTIWQTGTGSSAKFYFAFDDPTKEALGLAGIAFDPVPAGAVPFATQQQIRDDVLPAYARGLFAALFGPIMHEKPDEFLGFVGSDIDTNVESLRTAPAPSTEFNTLRNALVSFIQAIYSENPNADVSSLLAIAERIPLREGNLDDIFGAVQFFDNLATAVAPYNADAPEQLKRDLQLTVADIGDAVLRTIVGIPDDVLDRLVITSGGRLLYLLDEQRSATLSLDTNILGPIAGVGTVSTSRTQLGDALYVTVGAAQGYAFLRNIVELLPDTASNGLREIAEVIADEFGAAADFITAYANVIDRVWDGALDFAGNPFRNTVFGSFTYADGGAVTRLAEGETGIGDLLEFQVGADNAGLIGNTNDNVALHLGHGSVFGLEGDDLLIGWKPDFIAQGAPLDPADPNSELASQDYRLTLDGGSGNDRIVVIGGEGAIAKGGDGNDFLAVFGSGSGDEAAALDGGGGDDLLIAGGGATNMVGGLGGDIFHIGSNTIIKDAETTGDSIWMGLPIFGGSKQWWMEGNTAYWSPFSTLMTAFPVIGSQVLAAGAFFVDAPTMKFASFQMYEDGGLGINIGYGLGGVAKIEDYRLDLDSGAASGGVVVFEANRAGDASSGFQDPSQEQFMQFINLALKAGFGVGFGGWDPIVLDLDGDGYELTTRRNSGVYFEFDGDDFAEKTGWVRPDDGFLVFDANANGVVDDAGEFFGDETQGGFAELATHDGNADGVINANDAVFADLRVWRDLDGDGVTDSGELSSLSDLGIASISLAAGAPAEPIDIGGNTIAAEADVTMTDGSTRKAGDAVLDISHIDTRYVTDTTVSAAAAALPQLRGFGNVADLHMAMSEDAALLAQVDGFDQLTTSDLSVLKQAAENILYAWADVDGVIADPIGANGFDMRKLAFLEAFSGQEIAPRDPVTGEVSTAGLAELEDSWADTLQSLTLRLVVQSSGLSAFAGMTYRADLDLIVMGAADTLRDVYAAILSGLSTDPVTALAQWNDWGELLKAIQEGSRRFDNNIVRDDFAAAQLQAAIAMSGTAFGLADLAPAVGIDNLRMGTAVSETLTQIDGGTIFSGLDNGDIATGGTGQDVYLLARGFGSVTIDDEEGAKMGDRIRFVDIDRAEVSAERVGDDLVLTVDATGDTVTILGQFADVVPLSSDVIISNNLGVEEIQFADGAIMELPDIAIAVGEGTSGDDVMDGTMHTDVFQGRAGNDLLMGGDDADLYVFDLGDGADTIREQQTNPLLMAADMVILGDDIAPEDVVFSRGTDANDLVITIGTGGDSVTIDNQFDYSSLGYNHKWSPNTRVEIFSFRHFGDVYTHKDIQQQLIGAETTDSDDVTRGFGDDDFFAPSAGNDTFIGLDGNDTYYFGRGFGNDTVDEQALYIDVNVGLGGLSLEHGADTIVFAPDVSLGDVSFSRASEAPHLTITLDSGEVMTVKNQFDGFQTGPLGSQWLDRVEWFEFADGTRISWQDVLLDTTTGTDGDDSLWGDLFQDTLTGGLGNDYLSGGGYADTYIFNSGDGQDIVDDDNQFILGAGFVTIDTTPDILRFGAGITSADISIAYDAHNITLGIGSNGDAVTLQGQNDYYHTGVFGAISNSRIERIEFADGEVWTWQDLNQRAIASATSAGDDVTTGFDLVDRFEASAGNDVLRGGDSGDTYVFGIGSGLDRIEETVNNANFDDDDRVEFAAGLTTNDVAFERRGKDLIVRIDGTSDALTIAGQFNNYVGFTFDDIETFHFADGSVVTKAELMAEFTLGTGGDDTIDGFHISDTIVGGLGNDILAGKDGSDRYVFNLGDGQDTINESVRFANIADNDRIVFGVGILPSDISLGRSGNTLTLSINGTSDSITVNGQFDFTSWFSWSDVEYFEFADGTVWTKRDVANSLMGGTSGDDVIDGTFQNDELNGLEGNDLLRGGDGADIYYFGLGYGQDTIEETVTNANLSNFDQIVMGEGVIASDLTFNRNGDALTIDIAGTSDTITIAGQFDNYIGYTDHDIEQIQFTDGSIMTKEEIQSLLTVGTPADETVLGFHTSDLLNGGAGNDILRGLDGSDTYVFGRGSGNDIIRESVQYANIDDNDRIRFADDIAPSDLVWSRSGTTLTIGIVDTSDTVTVEGQLGTDSALNHTWRDVEFFDFADGTTLTKSDVRAILLTPTAGDDTIDGFWTSDVLRGAQGNDLLRGGEGDDGYLYDIGDGHDTISDFFGYYGNAADYIQFGSGIEPGDVTVELAESGSDMLLRLAAHNGSITIKNQISGGREWEIDYVRFADGTEWSKADLGNLLVQGQATAGDDVITGTSSSETFSGGAGNDQINAGSGDDIVNGGLGNDSLSGGNGQDRLVGGTGDDYVAGDKNNDTYVYNLGDGDDIFAEWHEYYGSYDILAFGEGIASEDLQFERSGEHFIVTFANAPGSITLNWQRTGGSRGYGREGGVNEFRFADGTVWDRSQIDAAYIADVQTDGDDLIYGTYRHDTIDGGLGNDTIHGSDGQDRLGGGQGNDYLAGNDGGDTYVYNLGDGDDTVDEWSDYYGTYDILELGAGIAPGDLQFERSGEDFVITFANAPGSITLKRQRTGGRSYGREGGVNEFRFADGTVWDRAQIDAAYLADVQTDGDDLIYGTFRHDTIDGGLGNDTIHGSEGQDRLGGGQGDDYLAGNDGDDTYVYNLGDGDEVIDEWSAYYGTYDILELGAGIAPGDLQFERSGEHFIVTFANAPGSITLNWQRTGGSRGYGREGGVNEFRFADGTVWNRAQIDAAYLADVQTDADDLIYGTYRHDTIEGGLGNDAIYGSNGNDNIDGGMGADTIEGGNNDDTIQGGAGDDLLYGNNNNDLYLYARGDGNDVIGDYQGEDTDTLRFTGISSNEVVFYSIGDHLFAKVLDSFPGANDGSTIEIRYGTDTGSEGVEIFEFADGTSLSDDAVVATRYTIGSLADDLMTGGTGDDRLFADYGNDKLTGGLGNDILNGSYGSDTAVYSGLSTEYSIITTGGTFQLRDDEVSIGSDEGTDTLVGIETLRFSDGQTVGITSPIILDLDGDGVETVSAADSGARFDLDSDGLADNTSWIGSGDAFLYLDRDGSGTISGVEEISFVDDVANAATDLDGLAAFDSNHDGVLDAQDDRFAEFGAWRDADGDGAVDAGETASLAQRGIVSINLSGTPVEGVTEFGEVAIANIGSFTLANGVTRQFADAALTYFSAADVVLSFQPSAGSNDRVFDLTVGPVRASAEFFQLRRHISETRLGAVPMSELFDLLRSDIGAAGTRLFDRFDSMFDDAVSAQRGARPIVPATSEASLGWPRGILEPISPHISRFVPFERLSLINEPLELQSRMQKLGGFGEEVPFDASDGAKRLHVIPARPTVLNAAIANDAEHANPAASDPELARKLAMIRQDMGAFGPNGAAELDRLHAPNLEYLQLYA